MPYCFSKSDIKVLTAGSAKAKPKLLRVLLSTLAALSSSAKALTACIAPLAPKAIPNAPAKPLTLLVSDFVAVSALLNAFLPVNSEAISITTLAIITPLYFY